MVKLRIGKLLQENQKTRYWLQKQTGIDFSTLNKLVNNEGRAIYFATIDKLCKAFNCSIADLFEYKED